MLDWASFSLPHNSHATQSRLQRAHRCGLLSSLCCNQDYWCCALQRLHCTSITDKALCQWATKTSPRPFGGFNVKFLFLDPFFSNILFWIASDLRKCSFLVLITLMQLLNTLNTLSLLCFFLPAQVRGVKGTLGVCTAWPTRRCCLLSVTIT